MNANDYKVCLHVGARPDLGALTYVALAPASGSPDDVTAAIAAAGVTAADLRARTVVAFDCEPALALQVYATLIGFAGRRINILVGDDVIDAQLLHNTATTSAETLDKPEEAPEFVQVARQGHPDTVHVPVDGAYDDEARRAVRYGRRVRIALDGLTTDRSLVALLTVAALRARAGSDRLPLIVDSGDEELFVGEGDDKAAVGHDTETYRRAGNELRRTSRIDDRSTVVVAADDTERLTRLRMAAQVPIEHTLILLGSIQNPDTGFWRCPRPARHRNGDANPSLRVVDGLVRCYRCDAEHVDSLRLVCDTLGLAPDDAARILTR